MHWWKMAIWKSSTKVMRREWPSLLGSTLGVVWGKLATLLRSAGMMWRELTDFLGSALVMRWELAVFIGTMRRKLSALFRSARVMRWKLAIWGRKLCTLLGSTRKLWRKLTSILRQNRRWKPAVFWWKLSSFLWSAKIRWWTWGSLGSSHRWRPWGIKLMERRTSHIWRWYSCHIWRWCTRGDHVGRQSSREWRLYHHWWRDHRMVSWKHGRPWWRDVRRRLS